MEADDLGVWSSLMERELRDPSPPSTPPPPVVAASLSSPRRPSIPPVAAPPVFESAPLQYQATPPPAPVSARPPAVADAPPESELQRAIREAAAGPPVLERAALWTEAASDLRGRRSNPPPAPLTPPPRPLPPASPPPPAPATTAAEAVEAPPPSARSRRGASRSKGGRPDAPASAPLPTPTPARVSTTPAPAATAPLIVHESLDGDEEQPRLRRARRAGAGRRGATFTAIAAVVIAGASLTWAIVERTSADGGSASARPVATPSPTPPVVTVAVVAAPRSITAFQPALPPSASSSPAAMASAPPPPPLRNPAQNGLLRIDFAEDAELYLYGVRAGTTNRWLEIACGTTNVRLARAGAPPPGHSFPVWLGESRTLLVRCGEVHAVRWQVN